MLLKLVPSKVFDIPVTFCDYLDSKFSWKRLSGVWKTKEGKILSKIKYHS